MTQEQISRSRLNAIIYTRIKDRAALAEHLRDMRDMDTMRLPHPGTDASAAFVLRLLGGLAAPW